MIADGVPCLAPGSAGAGTPRRAGAELKVQDWCPLCQEGPKLGRRVLQQWYGCTGHAHDYLAYLLWHLYAVNCTGVITPASFALLVLNIAITAPIKGHLHVAQLN